MLCCLLLQKRRYYLIIALKWNERLETWHFPIREINWGECRSVNGISTKVFGVMSIPSLTSGSLGNIRPIGHKNSLSREEILFFLDSHTVCWHKILLQCHFFCMLYFSMQSIFFLNFRVPQLMLQKLSKFGTACQYNHCKVNGSLSKHYLSWDRHCLPKFNINCSFAWDLYLIFTKVRSRSDVLPKIGQIPLIWISIFEQTWKIQTLESTLAMFGQKD